MISATSGLSLCSRSRREAPVEQGKPVLLCEWEKGQGPCDPVTEDKDSRKSRQ